MTGAALLPLLKEVEKHGGPVALLPPQRKMHVLTIRFPDGHDIAAPVYEDKDFPLRNAACLYGALISDAERRGWAWMMSKDQSQGFYPFTICTTFPHLAADAQYHHGDGNTPLEAVIKAWLSAARATREVTYG